MIVWDLHLLYFRTQQGQKQTAALNSNGKPDANLQEEVIKLDTMNPRDAYQHEDQSLTTLYLVPHVVAYQQFP